MHVTRDAVRDVIFALPVTFEIVGAVSDVADAPSAERRRNLHACCRPGARGPEPRRPRSPGQVGPGDRSAWVSLCVPDGRARPCGCGPGDRGAWAARMSGRAHTPQHARTQEAGSRAEPEDPTDMCYSCHACANCYFCRYF